MCRQPGRFPRRKSSTTLSNSCGRNQGAGNKKHPQSDFCEMPIIIQFSSGEYLQALHSHGGGAQYWSELLLITSEIYEGEKVARTLIHRLFHNIQRDLDAALRQAERSPEKAALSPVPSDMFCLRFVPRRQPKISSFFCKSCLMF